MTYPDGNETAASSAPAAAAASASQSDKNSINGGADDWTMARIMQAMETLTAVYGFSAEASSEALEIVAGGSTASNSNSGGSCSGSDSRDRSANATSLDELVAACCDYILDSGLEQDGGGPVTPIDDCPHVRDDNVCNTTNGTRPRTGIATATATATACGGSSQISVTAADVPDTIFEQRCCYWNTDGALRKRAPTGGFKDALEYDDSRTSTATATATATPACPMGENWWCLACGGIYCSRYVNGHGVEHHNLHRPSHCVAIGLADLSVWCHECGAYLETRNHRGLASILDRLREIKFGTAE